MPPKQNPFTAMMNKKHQRQKQNQGNKLSTESDKLENPRNRKRKLPTEGAKSEKSQKKRTMMTQHIEAKGVAREEFNASDLALLSVNEFGRYAFSNSQKIGHALITEDEAGVLSAVQYTLPLSDSTDVDMPLVCQLTQIQKVTRGPFSFYAAKGPQGEAFFGRRSHKQIDALGHEADVVYFSEREDFNDPDECDEDFHYRALKSQHPVIKGGRELKLDAASIALREQQSSRGASQNQIMKRDGKPWSARNEYERYFNENKDKFSPELQDIFKKMFTADIHSHAESQYRPEWLHAYGFSLFPQDEDPQSKDNLGAASKWVNSEMMIFERMAKWFAIAFANNAEVTIKALFEMLTDSEIIGKIRFEVSIEYQSFYTRFVQELYPIQESPVFHKPSDLAQAVGITQARLQGQAPLAIEHVTRKEEPYVPRVWQDVPQVLPQTLAGRTDLQILTIIDLETTKLDYLTGEIIEIGAISVYFHPDEGILGLKCQYQGLAAPTEPLSKEIIEITQLTDEMLAGQSIDWIHFSDILRESDYVACHNSAFDRKFLESATPDFIRNMICQMRFGCTLNGIDWGKKGFLGKKLVELNAQLKFRYTGHRALNDCWATINLLNQVPGALNELITDIHQEKTLICATDTDYLHASSLRSQNFSYASGDDGILPKCWYKYVTADELSSIKRWLDKNIYEEDGKSDTLPQISHIQAIDRYSVRVRPQQQRAASHFVSTIGHFADKSSNQRVVSKEEVVPSLGFHHTA